MLSLRMNFEHDPVKSASNRSKHGIDFDQAQALWDDPRVLEAPARTEENEPRFISIGKINGKHWAAVWTPRGDATRIISVRRARKEEIGYYEGNRVRQEV